MLYMTIMGQKYRLGRSICSIGDVLPSASVLYSSADIYQNRMTMIINFKTNISDSIISKTRFR